MESYCYQLLHFLAPAWGKRFGCYGSNSARARTHTHARARAHTRTHALPLNGTTNNDRSVTFWCRAYTLLWLNVGRGQDKNASWGIGEAWGAGVHTACSSTKTLKREFPSRSTGVQRGRAPPSPPPPLTPHDRDTAQRCPPKNTHKRPCAQDGHNTATATRARRGERPVRGEHRRGPLSAAAVPSRYCGALELDHALHFFVCKVQFVVPRGGVVHVHLLQQIAVHHGSPEEPKPKLAYVRPSAKVGGTGGGGFGTRPMVLVCLPLAAPIGLSPLLILTLCGSERVVVVSTEPPDDLSRLTTPGGRPSGRRGCRPCRGIHMHTPSPCGGLPTPALTCARWGVHLQDHFPDRGFQQPQRFVPFCPFLCLLLRSARGGGGHLLGQ